VNFCYMLVLDVAKIACIVREVISTFTLVLCRSVILFVTTAQQPAVGQGLLIIEDS